MERIFSMGVKTLWSILSGCGELTDLRELQGQRVAIDLAGWIVENSTGKGASNGATKKPHLRNLFFRTWALLSLNIRPVFVLDGDAPELKRDTMAARRGVEEVKSLSRRRLKGVMRECRTLLETLGVSCVASGGEAECLAGNMCENGTVDLVISDDSDTFCYGADTVLRNFSISTSQAEVFTMDKIRNLFNLDRQRLVLMAILLGCDFCPAGVPGVGKETVTQMLALWPLTWDAIEAFKLWAASGFQPDKNFAKAKGKKTAASFICDECLGSETYAHCDICSIWSLKVCSSSTTTKSCHCLLLSEHPDLAKLEESVKKKCLAMSPSFWVDDFAKIVDEFYTKEEVKMDTEIWFQCPNVDSFVDLASRQLAWTREYALEKVLPVLARWQVVTKSGRRVLNPSTILKKRVVGGTPCFSIRWQSDSNHHHIKMLPDTFDSVEPAVYVSETFPDLVAQYEATCAKKTLKKAKKHGVKKQEQKITQFFKENKEEKLGKGDNWEKLGNGNNLEKLGKGDNLEKLGKRDNLKKQGKENNLENLGKGNNLEKPVKENKEEEEQDSVCPEDLSAIIDDILSMKMERVLCTKEEEEEVKTSTPRVDKQQSVFRMYNVDSPVHKKQDSVVQEDEEDEDSFDRMCK